MITPRAIHLLAQFSKRETRSCLLFMFFPIIGLLMGIPQNNKGECFAEIIRFQALLENPTGKGESVDWVSFATRRSEDPGRTALSQPPLPITEASLQTPVLQPQAAVSHPNKRSHNQLNSFRCSCVSTSSFLDTLMFIIIVFLSIVKSGGFLNGATEAVCLSDL